MLGELPLFAELSIVKTSKAFEGYERNYSIEIIDSNDRSVQLTITKQVAKVFLKIC